MTGPVLLGMLLYVLVAAAPTLMFWVALRLIPAAIDRAAERRRVRRHSLGPSLESVVATLRRLRREMRCGNPPTQVRRLALLDAYDETLLHVCRIVGVDAALEGASPSDRPFARLLTEAALEAAGVALDPPARGAATG